MRAKVIKSPLDKVILDLCGGTGAWSRPYQEAGYDVRLVTFPLDVRKYVPPLRVHGVLASPPCTDFAIAGARWWKKKGEPDLSVVQACLRIIQATKPSWWALENPGGRLSKYIGPYLWSFQPWEFGDPWKKRTCLWGDHVIPKKKLKPQEPFEPQRWRCSLINFLSPIPTEAQLGRLARLKLIPSAWVRDLPSFIDRSDLRSITPPGFARAFFKANP